MVRKNVLDSFVQSQVAIQGLQEVKGKEIIRLNLQSLNGAISDYFIICTATSDKHAQALAGSVEDFMKNKARTRPLSIEGLQKGEWILLDYVDVVVHIFTEEKRVFYRLESLWGDAESELIPDVG